MAVTGTWVHFADVVRAVPVLDALAALNFARHVGGYRSGKPLPVDEFLPSADDHEAPVFVPGAAEVAPAVRRIVTEWRAAGAPRAIERRSG